MGYEDMQDESDEQSLINKVQVEATYNKEATRHDELSFVTAKEYKCKNKPRIVLLGFGHRPVK